MFFFRSERFGGGVIETTKSCTVEFVWQQNV